MKYAVKRNTNQTLIVDAVDEHHAEELAETRHEGWVYEVQSQTVEEYDEPRSLKERLRHIADRYDMTKEDSDTIDQMIDTLPLQDVEQGGRLAWQMRYENLKKDIDATVEENTDLRERYVELSRKYDSLTHKWDMVTQYVTRDK